MKRLIFKLALFLILGAIINIAVAWGCIWSFETTFDQYPYEDISAESNWWQARSPEGFVFKVRNGGTRIGRGVMWRAMCNLPNEIPRDPLFVSSDYLECGWPLRSCSGGKWTQARMSTGLDQRDVHQWAFTIGWNRNDNMNGWDFSKAKIRLNTFPFAPLFPGFAINTIFYAAVLWLLFAFPFVLRRKRRIKRGLCPACAYPFGRSAVCTECGKQLQGKGVVQRA